MKVIASRTLGFWPEDLDDPVGDKAGGEDEEEYLPAQFPCYDPFDQPVSPASPSDAQKLRDSGKPVLVPIVNPRTVSNRNPDISLENFRPRVKASGPVIKPPPSLIKVEPSPCVPMDWTVDEAVPVLDLTQSSMDLSQGDHLLSMVEEDDPNYMLVDWPRPVFVEDYKELADGSWIGTQLLDFYLHHVHQNLPSARQNDIYLFTTDLYRAWTRDRQTLVRDANLFDKENQL